MHFLSSGLGCSVGDGGAVVLEESVADSLAGKATRTLSARFGPILRIVRGGAFNSTGSQTTGCA
eukprot:926469-Amphidinium_carterae.1